MVFVSANTKRLDEVQQIWDAGEEVLPLEVASMGAGLPKVEDFNPTEIAIAKCKAAVEKVNGPVLCEDTCLCVSALGGLPGPNINWDLLMVGLLGLHKKFAAYEDKSSYAQCICAVCAGPGCEARIFDRKTIGRVVFPSGPEDLG